MQSPVRVALFAALVASIALGSAVVNRAAAGIDSGERTAHTVASTRLALEGTVRAHHDARPVKLEGQLLAYRPVPQADAPTVVYLHGRDGRAENGCPWMRAGARDLGWLVCPEAIEKHADGKASWGSDVFAQGAAVERALATATRAGASSGPAIVVGFSQGSYVALDLVKTNQGHFRGLVLLAAPQAHPSAANLHARGITRIALGAGARDDAHDVLVEDVKRLQREGMDARFFDLGDVGHTYIAKDPDVLREAITWAAGQDAV